MHTTGIPIVRESVGPPSHSSTTTRAAKREPRMIYFGSRTSHAIPDSHRRASRDFQSQPTTAPAHSLRSKDGSSEVCKGCASTCAIDTAQRGLTRISLGNREERRKDSHSRQSPKNTGFKRTVKLSLIAATHFDPDLAAGARDGPSSSLGGECRSARPPAMRSRQLFTAGFFTSSTAMPSVPSSHGTGDTHRPPSHVIETGPRRRISVEAARRNEWGPLSQDSTVRRPDGVTKTRGPSKRDRCGQGASLTKGTCVSLRALQRSRCEMTEAWRCIQATS